MGKIRVNKERFSSADPNLLDSRHPALWTFSIQDRDICFWGTFHEAAHTARLYAEHHGMTEGAITLLDHTGTPSLRTVH